MITTEEIKKLASKYQTTEANIRQEYIQHLFLSYFYTQPQTKEIFFKGGTALRLLYKSPRFSEDLDFNASIRDILRIEEAVLDTLREIEREGLQPEIIEAKKTTGGYLAITTFHLSNDKVTLQLEISMRNKDARGEIVTVINNFIPAYVVMRLVEKELIREKITALLTRKKPRDFYDLYFLLRADLLPMEYKRLASAILKTLQTSTIDFAFELKKFLPKTHWPVITDFKTLLINELRRYV